ncbi:unnamed protein product [Medioppia subpectinata]|uniref:Uncharacterized protein n=1 Tax=Medioppia subpectinata TaxID=1979941 RepID=A0A7R9PX82_9ACAR|nr:unnamed protein product [Medioppia subpectinata]CAG2104550.1 unnamed protein product [Medioppia subpectinata]
MSELKLQTVNSKCGHNLRVDEVMATEDNDSQTWHQINQITHKDITNHQMLRQFKAINTLCLKLQTFQSILNNNYSVLNETIECENNFDLDINQTIVCKTFKISETLLSMNETKSSDNFSVINNTINNNNYFRCFWPNCHFKTKFNVNLNRHQLIHSNIKPFKCDFNDCNKSYNHQSLLINHKNNVHLNKRFKCDFNDCNKYFTQKSHVIKHKSSVHLNEKQFKCDVENCDKSYTEKRNLMRHKCLHSGEMPFICFYNNCNKGFKTKSELVKHKNSVHFIKRFKCDFNVCNKSFATNQRLNEHKNCVHLIEKRFKCNVENCGKSFGLKSFLNQHKRRHSGEKPFKCGFNECNKCFVQKHELLIHQNCVHLKQKPFKCIEENCGQSFGLKSRLNLHKLTHSGEKPFKCDFNVCNKNKEMAYELDEEYRNRLIEHTARGTDIEPHPAPYGHISGQPIQGPPHWPQIWPTYADTGVAHQRYTSVHDPLTAEDLAYLQTAHVGSVGAIKFDKILGAGCFANVWQVEAHNGWGRTRHMACKEPHESMSSISSISSMSSEGSQEGIEGIEDTVKQLMGDMFIHQCLPFHSNIVECVDIVGIPDPQTGFPYSVVCVFTELCDGVLLRDGDNSAMSEAHVLEWVRQIAGAVRFLHVDQRMVHVDIKPGNILYNCRPTNGTALTNCAILFPVGVEMRFPADCPRGDDPYAAPELGLDSCWAAPCDMWSLAASVAHCLLGFQTFIRLNKMRLLQLFQAVARNRPVPLAHPISAGVAKLVADMMARDPNQRPAIGQFPLHREMAHELNEEYRKRLIEHTARGAGIEPHPAPYGTDLGWDPMTYNYRQRRPKPGEPPIERPIQGPPHWTQIWPTYADTGVAHQRYTSVADPLTAEDLAYLQTAHVGSVGAIKFDKLLGSGTYGAVWQVESYNGWGRTRQMACKVFFFQDLQNWQIEENVAAFMTDMFILQSLPSHDNIVDTVDIVGIPDAQTGFPYSVVCLFTELCDGDLQSIIVEPLNQNGMPEAQVLEWVRDIASALRFLHVDNRMVHIDVKPDNILYTASVAGRRRTYKLCDFGFGVQFPIDTVMEFPKGAHTGTHTHASPELGVRQCLATPCDVYSLGATVANALLGSNTFSSLDKPKCLKLFQALARSIPVRLKNPISVGVAKLVETLLATDPTQRPAIGQFHMICLIRQEMDHELNPEYRKRLIEHTARDVAIEPHAAPYGTALGWDPMTYKDKKGRPKLKEAPMERPIQGPPHWTQIWPTYADTGLMWTHTII